ncbi:MAG: hypothetical protein AAF843_11115 [Bacteroidota bacterium]
MWTFLLENPFYIPFIALNIWVIYKVIKIFVYRNDDNTDDDDDNDDGILPDDPELDLPPGVSLPTEPKELVTY